MTLLPYETIETADTRSAAMWAGVRGSGWQPDNVTQYLYGRRVRTGDPELDADLPAEGDAFVVVAERDEDLDTLIAADTLTALEAVPCAPLYPAWASGVAYAVDDIVTYGDDLYVVRQAHTSQADWQPPNVLALYRVYRSNADTLLAWIASESVQVGWQRTYDGATYECIQAHVTQSDWTPDAVPTLWALVTPPTEEWAAGVAYTGDNTAGAGNGDVVSYQGVEYRCLQSHTSISTWTPPATPALWLRL